MSWPLRDDMIDIKALTEIYINESSCCADWKAGWLCKSVIRTQTCSVLRFYMSITVS
jgi:hypothetical protein